jgi:hypothetical protein
MAYHRAYSLRTPAMAASLSASGRVRVSVEASWYVEMLGTSPVVHQAVGMIAALTDASLEEAAVRLRYEAVAAERPVEAVAADVVDRRLRFD